jgi:GntR family transcriptional regulator, transcriptional repressor for pyruvate dehydrogenase complex
MDREGRRMLETIERSRLSDAVARKIKQYITARSLKPGDRLPTEHSLAEQLGVSRISIREATKALEFVGLLDARPGRGITVGRVDMGRVSEYLGFHLAINDYPPLQLIETRIVIETGGLPHAARRMAEDPGLYDRLRDQVDRSRGTRDLQEWIDLDIAFHRALLEASGLAPLVAFNDLLQIFFQRFRESVKKAEWKRGVESHLRMIDCLRDQRLAEACDEMRRHIESHKERVGVRA